MVMASYAAQASSKGGAMVLRGRLPAWVTASLIRAALGPGNSDQSKAIAPVTKGAAALVPPEVWGWPFVPRLMMFCPGAPNPRLPMELPKFDSEVGRPSKSQPMTAITHG